MEKLFNLLANENNAHLQEQITAESFLWIGVYRWLIRREGIAKETLYTYSIVWKLWEVFYIPIETICRSSE